MDRRRCIIPADGFYEWRKEGKRKVPMWVHLKTRDPFAFAGLWDVWRKPDGKRVESFTIITTEPNQLMRPIHNRMPVTLSPQDEQQWLDASRTPFAKAKSLLKPYPNELMDAHDVSPIVNSAKYHGPQCIQPVSDDEIRSRGQLSLLRNIKSLDQLIRPERHRLRNRQIDLLRCFQIDHKLKLRLAILPAGQLAWLLFRILSIKTAARPGFSV